MEPSLLLAMFMKRLILMDIASAVVITTWNIGQNCSSHTCTCLPLPGWEGLANGVRWGSCTYFLLKTKPWVLEDNETRPQFEVTNMPGKIDNGIDPQLEKSVENLMNEINKKKMNFCYFVFSIANSRLNSLKLRLMSLQRNYPIKGGVGYAGRRILPFLKYPNRCWQFHGCNAVEGYFRAVHDTVKMWI